LWLKRFLQAIRMPGANGDKYLIGGNGAAGVIPQGAANLDNFLAKPLLDRGVTLLQGPQTGSHNFASGSIGAGLNKGIDVSGLFGGQAESPLFG
jgi:hypothetical protein